MPFKYQSENLLNCKSKRLENLKYPLIAWYFHTLHHSTKQYKMARKLGFEPRTLGLEDRCSIQLSYSRKYLHHYRFEDFFGNLEVLNELELFSLIEQVLLS